MLSFISLATSIQSVNQWQCIDMIIGIIFSQLKWIMREIKTCVCNCDRAHKRFVFEKIGRHGNPSAEASDNFKLYSIVELMNCLIIFLV